MTKIFICSDILMTSETEQQSNLRWLADLLSRPVGMATGVAPVPLSSVDLPGRGGAICRAEIFAAAGVPFDAGATQFWFDGDRVRPAAVEALRAAGLGPDTLLIGYELSAETKAVLRELGVIYVDIWLHPVRFYDDILFAFQSNDPGVHAAFGAFHVPESQFYLYADRLRIQTYKGWHRVEAGIADGAALFVGQTLNDKSVIREGRMLNLLDFKAEFEDLGARHARVYYARHPYLREGDEEILAYLKACPFAELTREPVYRMLASPKLAHVTSISSSVVHEARYFGKEAGFLFRPVIEYADPASPEQYATVCQDFISPHFWADVLAPVMATTPCAPILFRDRKDKLRDMLGFYWSYGQIDKAEATRVRANDTARRVSQIKVGETRKAPAKPQPTANAWRADLSGFVPNAAGIAALQRAIGAAGIVSFDVFETLVERPLEAPDNLFLLMGEEVRAMFGEAIPSFVKARREARALAAPQASGEEVTLDLRYRALARAHGLDDAAAARLLQLELDWERRLCRPRLLGREAFDMAKAAGKRIILVSDTYFDEAFVEEILRGCGYEGWDRLYVSSTTGLLKASGAIYPHILAEEAVAPGQILHVGDNPKSDIARAKEAGLAAFDLRTSMDIATRTSPVMPPFAGIGSTRTRGAVRGMLARKLGSGRVPEAGGYSRGDAHLLGYALGGPLFFGFVTWLQATARERGIDRLFFLSRDGDIVKRCYDALFADRPDAPESRYVLSSRRSVRTATLESVEDILAVLRVNFTACPLRSLLRNRFGLDAAALPGEALRAHGFAGPDVTVDPAVDFDALCNFFSDPRVAEPILENAAEEREALIAYYAREGLDSSPTGRDAIVDIGHEGSLQAGLRRLLGRGDLAGFYFATFREITANLSDAHVSTSGYLIDRLDRAKDRHSYCDLILMYEMLFLNDQGSFLRVRRDGGTLHPEVMEVDEETRRIAFIRACHDGIVEFCRDMQESFGDLAPRFRLTGNEATAGYRAMLMAPFIEDARLFVGLSMENKYSGRDVQYIVPEDGHAAAIWKQGAEVVWLEGDKSRFYGLFGWRRVLTPFVAPFVRRLGSAEDERRYREDPVRYFAGLRSPKYTRIGAWLYPALYRK